MPDPTFKDEIDLRGLSAYALIELLAKITPHQCIVPGQPEWHAHRYAGRRELVDELLSLKDEDEERTASERGSDDAA